MKLIFLSDDETRLLQGLLTKITKEVSFDLDQTGECLSESSADALMPYLTNCWSILEKVNAADVPVTPTDDESTVA
jgi:hypothetical protein